MTRVGSPVIFTLEPEINSQEFLRKEEGDNLYINLNEPYSSNLNMNSNKIVNISCPVDSSDAINKEYVDAKYLHKSQSPIIDSNLNMNNNRMINISKGEGINDVANVKQVKDILDREIGVKVRIRNIESSNYVIARTTPVDHQLFSDYFIHAFIIDFKVNCYLNNEHPHEEFISYTDPRLSNIFQKRVKIENRWFIITAGRV